MFDIIIRSALDIVGRTERLIDAMRRRLQNDDLDEVQVYELGDVVFNVDEAVRSLARTVECWPQAALAHGIRRTLH
ncbi:hypothetical protein [Rhizobium leguminosarum]|uniref:hypothetical protein n=1 Tax=Rhizobium leguminosarum TaxID=384 RepID=UPI001618CB81|nr:hypothetical protein [Rhizobium leguminosarum]MBB4506779.1 hypothetical protein [Rhizobium leguminosarum]